MYTQRITSGYMYSSVLNNLFINRDLLVDLQTKIASGKEFNKASEDVFSATTVINTNASMNKINTYLTNINNAKSELETADKALLTTLDSVHKTRELTVQALNLTSGEDEMVLIGEQVEQLIEQVKSLANTKYGQKYIFGGQVTGTAPFTDGPNTGEIQYNGSKDGSGARQIEIAEGVFIDVNLNGDDVFGYYYTGDHDKDGATPDTLEGQGLLQTLVTLREELRAGNQDKDVINQKLADLDTDLGTLLEAQSTLGGILERLDVTEQIHEDDLINLTKTKSDAQDVDLAEAISDLTFQETVLQASLAVSARVIQPSIMNYI